MAPFARYLVNTFCIVTLLLVLQLLVCTLAGYALARLRFPGRGLVFAIVMLQLMVMPEVLITENYVGVARLGQVDHYLGVALPYIGSAFGIFLLRQTFMMVPQEAGGRGAHRGHWAGWRSCSRCTCRWPGPPTWPMRWCPSGYHWNNFLWPLVVTNTEASRPVTVGMALFAAPETGVDWGVLSAGTLLSVGPLLVAFLLFQRQFMQSFMNAGIKWPSKTGPARGGAGARSVVAPALHHHLLDLALEEVAAVGGALRVGADHDQAGVQADAARHRDRRGCAPRC